MSANAFDKGLDNDLGITPADFLLKPVRMAELLGWLQQRLSLQWLDEARTAPAPADSAAPELLPPPAESLRALDELVRLGYLRGIQKKLDAIAAEHPASAGYIDRLRGLARGFQLDTMAHLIQSALAPAAEVTPAATVVANAPPPALPDAA